MIEKNSNNLTTLDFIYKIYNGEEDYTSNEIRKIERVNNNVIVILEHGIKLIFSSDITLSSSKFIYMNDCVYYINKLDAINKSINLHKLKILELELEIKKHQKRIEEKNNLKLNIKNND